MLSAVVGAIAAALVVGLGARAPVPAVFGRAGSSWAVRRGSLLGATVTVSLVLLAGTLLGAGATGAGGMLVLLVAAVLGCMGLAAIWSWLRLRRAS
ncbi:MAG: hypothetical protein ACYCYK_11990 [Candidatus Dormibacteria bacterium]